MAKPLYILILFAYIHSYISKYSTFELGNKSRYFPVFFYTITPPKNKKNGDVQSSFLGCGVFRNFQFDLIRIAEGLCFTVYSPFRLPLRTPLFSQLYLHAYLPLFAPLTPLYLCPSPNYYLA